MKKMAVLLLALLLLAGFACAEESVTAYLPGDTQALTSFAVEEAFSAQKKGYQTVGWRITVPDDEAFMAYIDGYRDALIDQGFTLAREVRPNGLNAVYYFFDHPAAGLTSARMNGIDFDLYLCGESGKGQMAMVLGVVPGINLSEPPAEESWESVFGEEEPAWESVLDVPAEEEPVPDEGAENVIPSFASFAKAAILSQTIENGREAYTLEMKNLSALMEYMMVLELNYGVSGQDGGETKYGLPMYLVLEDYEGELEPDRCTIMLASGEKEPINGYVFFSLDEKDDLVKLAVWYAMGMTPANTGDRWNGMPLEGEYLEGMQQMFFEARTSGQNYPFRNDALAKYVANRLEKDVSAITWTDVRDFNELIGVTVTDPDLSDLENMSLTSFSVIAKTEEAIDLSCLKNSEYLRILALVDGQYTGYETLAEKKWLERVLLSAESINDISWLENKELVRFVSIHDCSITDFSALATLPRLEQVYLEISLSDDVSFLYGKGLDFGDTYTKPTCTFDEWYEHNWGKPGGEPTPQPTAKPTVKPADTDRDGERCSTCGGDGWREVSCSSCGGDGDVERSCANCGGDGERDCMSCAGKGYDNCSGCYGSGDRRCGACYGTGKDGDKRCSSCGGDGEKNCSSCSGTGRKRCSACSGTGDRNCTYCGGDGRKEANCSSCSGTGRDRRTCTTCGGDGWR